MSIDSLKIALLPTIQTSSKGGAAGDLPSFHSSILPILAFLVDAEDELLY